VPIDNQENQVYKFFVLSVSRLCYPVFPGNGTDDYCESLDPFVFSFTLECTLSIILSTSALLFPNFS